MESKRQKLDLEKVDEINENACYIHALPDEIIEKIFSYLTQNQLGQIARLCRRWSVLTKSPVLWKKVNVKILYSCDKEKDAESFRSFIDGLPPCVTFIRLHLSGRAGLGYLNFEKQLCMKLHHNCHNVEELILSLCTISTELPEVINTCTQFLHSLKKLAFHNCSFKDSSGTVELEDNSNIEVLDLCYSPFSYFRTAQFSKLSSLKELRLAGTDTSDACFVGFSVVDYFDASLFNQLRVLDLRRTKITAFTLQFIQRHGENLKELYLCGLELGDNDLRFNNPHLQTICLCDTYVTSEGLASLVWSSPSLVSVYVEERKARLFAGHPLVVAGRCKSGIVKSIDFYHNHSVNYSHN